MTPLTIQSTIERELQTILQDAIQSGKIGTKTLRMVVLSPDSNFGKLDVYITNDWDSYFSKKDHAIIGTINISEWLDVADAALENQQNIDITYIEQAKEITKKYLTTQPAIRFNHLEILNEAYIAFLVCLREELLTQIEVGIAQVATSYSQEDFTHIVGFFTHALRFDLTEKVVLQAFNHTEGIGPFYQVNLNIPEYNYSKHFLRFSQTGFHLFCMNGTLTGRSKTESEVYSYDTSEIAYMYRKDTDIIFRLKDEFKNWSLCSKGSEIKTALEAEQAFLQAFNTFFSTFPEKEFIVANIPNPITENEAFDSWFSMVLEYNIEIYRTHRETIFKYGEEAYAYYLQQIPKTNVQYESAITYLASQLFFLNRFQESIDVFDTVVVLSDFQKIQYLCSLFLLKNKEAYTTYAATIETKEEVATLELLDTLWLLREPMEQDALIALKEKLIPLVETYKNKEAFYLLSVVLTKVCVALNERDNALLHVQSVPTHETFEKIVLQHELKNADYILEAYEKQIKQKERAVAFDKQVEEHSLNTEKNKTEEIHKTSYEHCYYVSHKIEVEKYTWVYPLDAETFISTQKENGPVLTVSKITDEQTVEILKQMQLPTTHEVDLSSYTDGVVYITDTELGIIGYNTSEKGIEESKLAYINEKAKKNYQSHTIADGYVYACNNNYLEIYSLHTAESNPISDSLYIQSAGKLFVHNNLLVASGGAGSLILIDVTDKTNPLVHSTIQEDYTPRNMFIEFIGDYMISQSIFNIQDPATPICIRTTKHNLAPTYYFAPKPEVPIISTGEEFLFTTLRNENDQATYTNWFESLNEENFYYERALHNLATAYMDDRVITYSDHQIILWEKGLSPTTEKIDVHADIETMVQNCFNYIVEEHPTFSIGKIVLEHNHMYQHIDIAFHAASSLAVLIDSTKEHDLPIISSTFLLSSYCEEVFQCDYNPMKMEFVYDAETIVEKLIYNLHFPKHSARHVFVLANNESTYVYNSSHPWNPFRIEKNLSENRNLDVQEETIAEIILSKNDARIQKLATEIDASTSRLNELLEILNKLYIPPHTGLSNKMPSSEEAANTLTESYEFIDNTDTYEDSEEDEDTEEEYYCSPTYIVNPYISPKIEDCEEDTEIEEETQIDGEYYTNKEETYALKTKAFEILCSLSDRTLARNILFNGMNFDYMHYNLKDLPASITFNKRLIYDFIRNEHGIRDEFGKDPEIRLFLLSIINQIDDIDMQTRIAYACEQRNHPLISEYIINLIREGISYDTFKGYFSSIDLSTFSAEALKPFESLLLEKLAYFESTTDSMEIMDAKEQLPYIYVMLQKLGYDHIPAIVSKKMMQAVKEQERYGPMLPDDDDYEEEGAFFATVYRTAKVKRLLSYFKNNTGALWPLEEALELYEESWNKTIEALFEQGAELFGETFKTDFIERLATHIPLDESFANDRLFVFELIQYTYTHILKKPAFASIVEPLVLALHQNKDVFLDTIDIAALKNKNKLTLLQAAWNDLKNKEWDLAEEKADAVLIMDPAMAQVYFLKARLLWLREGIPAYLAQQDYFIDKSAHDIAALGRLYNLSGCALDVEKRYEEALPYFKKAALNVPSEPMYVANVAEMYYKLGKSKEAVKHAKAARANGNEGEILQKIIDNKGVITVSE
ncbi:hypothetical protein [uncultured Cytophaga sp.]|uniref:hypothetical protein n=1 Tax=uncultured Cytophaga sp. TaxID=160238 RepID=UPI002604A93B|nr:hypothetical protein [uncultured Cytophaga sp.]